MSLMVYEVSGSGISAITNGFTTAVGTLATDLVGAIGAIVPVAFPVLAGVIGVSMCIRIIRKVIG